MSQRMIISAIAPSIVVTGRILRTRINRQRLFKTRDFTEIVDEGILFFERLQMYLIFKRTSSPIVSHLQMDIISKGIQVWDLSDMGMLCYANAQFGLQ
jgi:hypothetical protein